MTLTGQVSLRLTDGVSPARMVATLGPAEKTVGGQPLRCPPTRSARIPGRGGREGLGAPEGWPLTWWSRMASRRVTTGLAGHEERRSPSRSLRTPVETIVLSMPATKQAVCQCRPDQLTSAEGRAEAGRPFSVLRARTCPLDSSSRTKRPAAEACLSASLWRARMSRASVGSAVVSRRID